MPRLALLLSLLGFGALGLGACDDDDETATAETEVITSEIAQDPTGGGRVAVEGGSDACGDYRTGRGDIVLEIDVLRGVVRCREVSRVLTMYFDNRDAAPWSCVDYGEDLIECELPGVGSFAAVLVCRAPGLGERADCPGFAGSDAGELATPDPPSADLNTLPARRSCGHFRITLPPGEHRLINVEVLKGNVPCRVARRVLQTQYNNGNPAEALQAARPWRCAGPEGLIVCHKNPGPHHQAIRARFRE